MLRVECYKNLHKDCFSVRRGGRVIQYADSLVLFDATFAVQPAGRQKVLDQKRKNVHAFVRGSLGTYPVNPDFDPSSGIAVSYNPYKFGFFYVRSTDLPIFEAEVAFLTNSGVFVWTQNDYSQFSTTI